MSSIYTNFVSAIQGLGLTPPERVLADGRLHRFRSGPERAENGFYSLSILPARQGGEIGFGLIGCWKRDVREKWCSRDPKSVSQADREAMDRVRKDQKQEEETAAVKAAEKANWIWRKAGAPDAAHPYLTAKGIAARGLRQYKGMLVVPVHRDGGLVSLQFIAPDGSKRFLSGGQIEGGYASITSREAGKNRIIIAEGYATAASLFEATGLPVVVAFNCSNLLPVAKTIRAKYPNAEIIIAADNDLYC